MESMIKKHLISGIIVKAVAITASIYGIMRTTSGIMTFTYFTNLSNIAVDIILSVFLVLDIRALTGRTEIKAKPNILYVIKFMLTISITLTFLVYMFLLAPTNEAGILHSYFDNYAGSFCVHFVTPVLAIMDFFLFDYLYRSTPMHAFYATIPPLVYVIYVVIAGYSGVRWNGTMYAPYNFLNFGAATGWFGYDLSKLNSESLGIGVAYMIIVLLFIFIGIGFLYLKIKDIRYKSVMKQRNNKIG